MKFTIYHIPGVKIGCSKRVEQRVKEQGYSNFEVLETHTNIELASIREKELQKQYGYEELNVKTDYKQQFYFGEKGRKAASGLGAKSQIKNKIGMFGFSKEQRLEVNKKASILGAKASGEANRREIKAFIYKTNKFITNFNSIKEAATSLNLSSGNIHSVINGSRNHTKGYRFEYV